MLQSTKTRLSQVSSLTSLQDLTVLIMLSLPVQSIFRNQRPAIARHSLRLEGLILPYLHGNKKVYILHHKVVVNYSYMREVRKVNKNENYIRKTRRCNLHVVGRSQKSSKTFE